MHQAADTDLSLAAHTKLVSSTFSAGVAVGAVGAFGIFAPDAQSVPVEGSPSPGVRVRVRVRVSTGLGLGLRLEPVRVPVPAVGAPLACWSGFDFCSLSPPLAHLVRARIRV